MSSDFSRFHIFVSTFGLAGICWCGHHGLFRTDECSHRSRAEKNAREADEEPGQADAHDE